MKKLLKEDYLFRIIGSNLNSKKMKLTFLFSFLLFSMVWAESYSQTRLDLNLKNVPVRKFIQEIEDQTDFFFLYQDDVVEKGQRVTIQVDNLSLEEILKIFEEQVSVISEVTDKQIVLKRGTVNKSQQSAWQPEKQVKGFISDQKGQPLPGVTVTVQGTTTGTVTNASGEFSLTIPADAKNLQFSFVGMETQIIPVGDRTTFTVVMEEAITELEEIVAVGYGTMSREVLTTSVSKLNTQVLENVSYANVASALQGTIAGLRVQSTSGQPGATPRIILRGGTSIDNPNGATPLYIVDGVIRESGLDFLNQHDIESIQVLKDAAATSIYGARASNGVIIVETKSGKAGVTRVTYNYNLVSSDVGRLYDLADAKTFVKFMRMGIAASGVKTASVLNFLTQANAGGIGNDLTNNTAFTLMELNDDNRFLLDREPDQWGAVWETMADPLDASRTLVFKGTDFQKTVFRRSYSHDHNLNISGGSDKATFNMGLGYLNNQGIAINTDYKRISFNVSGEVKVTDKLKFHGQVIYSKVTDSDVPSVGTVFKNNINTAQTSKYQFEDGTLAPGRLFTNGNPAYYISRYDAKQDRDYSTLSFGFNWEILPGLIFDPQVSLTSNQYYSRDFLKSYLNGPTTLVQTRQATGSQAARYQYQADPVLKYFTSFNNVHNIDAIAGFSYWKHHNRNVNATGRDAATDMIPTLNASATPWSVGGSESEMLLYGYFGRVNYNYDQRYLLTFNARYDGASNLGAQYKWGFFPGISLGWNLHNENFWDAVPGDISLKLRASYGVNGNISGLGHYEAQGNYALGSRYNDKAAIYNSALANDQLKWEESTTLNFGFDLGLFNGRINTIVDIYRRVTDNLLTDLAMPRSTGFTSILTNLGSLENKGFEIELNAQILPSSSEFQWNAALNVGLVKMKIIELPENGIENNRIGGVYIWDPEIGDYAWKGGLQEGGEMGDLFAYKQLSIYATDEEAAAGPVDNIVPGTDKTKHGGDVNWFDADGNNIISETDRVYMGNIYPDWTGGFTNTFSYKNLSLRVRTDFTLGHMIYNETKARVLGNFSGQNAISAAVAKSWQKQGDVTDIPRYYWADQNQKSNLYRGNSHYYEPGDFLAIREVSLAYTLPKNLIKEISSLRFNITGENLYYFTKYTGLNPEEGGTDGGRYPLPRNIIFGVQITPAF